MTKATAIKNTSYLLPSVNANNVETDLMNEALKWAGLTAALEVLNA